MPPQRDIFYQLSSVNRRLLLQVSVPRLPCSRTEHAAAAQESPEAESEVPMGSSWWAREGRILKERSRALTAAVRARLPKADGGARHIAGV